METLLSLALSSRRERRGRMPNRAGGFHECQKRTNQQPTKPTRRPMLKKILIVVVVIIVVFLVIVALQPADFHVARSVAIAAPPEAVFPQVNELKKWEAWSPWMKID